jgi:hypothetical protein
MRPFLRGVSCTVVSCTVLSCTVLFSRCVLQGVAEQKRAPRSLARAALDDQRLMDDGKNFHRW